MPTVIIQKIPVESSNEVRIRLCFILNRLSMDRHQNRSSDRQTGCSLARLWVQYHGSRGTVDGAELLENGPAIGIMPSFRI